MLSVYSCYYSRWFFDTLKTWVRKRESPVSEEAEMTFMVALESDCISSLTIIPRRVFNKMFVSHCLGGWNGSSQMVTAAGSSPHHSQHFSGSPWDREGRSCLKLSRHYRRASVGLRIPSHTPQLLLSSGRAEINWGFKLLYSEYFTHCVLTVHDLGDCLSLYFCCCDRPKATWKRKGLFSL